ncbi:cadmium-translocating P-type ATPase [Ferruginibacter lapsinanis]|uniref:heavy metal translocating P-type ATPase n=1 Tax=Ferruginibacter lapsinanis TaxID=563172 RepID=UPI001E2DD5C4|nr:cation-translocating P-type ATPase [Ferruginibacter lapsinanis]UEG51103.1 cadmium-translocating P-type ATPase [Ferruginibacter lapsinanis]
MEKVDWKVEGMDCTNCALTITKYLKKEGLDDVKVNFIGGDVSFVLNKDQSKEKLAKGIEDLGYHVASELPTSNSKPPTKFFTNHFQRFLFCLPFTATLMLHMLPWHIHFLMNPWIQLFICLPVFIVGMGYFGVSAFKSLRRGIPNMNVLIAIGSLAAFVYSLIGTIGNMGPEYVFYETTATIITLVFLGEWIENKSVSTTQKELNKLARQQKVMANMIAFDDEHKEQIFPVENSQLRVGDLVLIKNGEQVPADCKILWGDAHVNEALLTGESKPVYKQKKDNLIGGSIVTDGTLKAQVTAVGKDTVLSNILNLVKQAQGEKPPIQQLADKISAVFVPVVIGISILTFLLNYFAFSVTATDSLMRSIAVLVISCPCAMGLATPAAIAVGLGRATKKGILFRNAKSLELFKNITTVVFDKTGTLTKGQFIIANFETTIAENEFKQIVFSLEKYSTHPIAKAISEQWKINNPINWKKIDEIKGIGIKAEDTEGNIYFLGKNDTHNEHTAYLSKNNEQIGWFDMDDEIREEAKAVIDYLHSKNIQTILLSGDSKERSQKIADAVGITKVYAETSPEEKLKIIEQLNNASPTAMVGDGINDAPALAKATIGISMSDASHLAMQSAQVVLMNNGIQHLPLALGLGKHTFTTIKENLFWAFIYNVVAIPIAAMGFLQPGIAALAMGFSDVVLAINSIRLNYKKVI